MLWTPARRAAGDISRALQKLLPKELPPSLAGHPANLYEILSRNPNGVARRKVHQVRWGVKGISDSYWLVTRAAFKCEGKHGKAWGWLYWKGIRVSPREERIKGSLKYTWADGPSTSSQNALPPNTN